MPGLSKSIRRVSTTTAAVVLTGCALAPGWAQKASSTEAPITITADLTDAPRKLIRADMEIPVQAGPVTLTAAKWIPGDHRPSGPIDNIAGLTIHAGDKVLPWQRDDVDMYAFHVEVPQGVSRLSVHVDYLAVKGSTVSSDEGSTSGNLAMLEWEEVLLYPAKTPVRQIAIVPSVKLPTDWKLGTALKPEGTEGNTTKFAQTTVEMLEDSPVLAGRYLREIALAPEVSPKNYLDVAGDAPEDVELKPAMIDSLSRLVRETGAMYASRHYGSYHLLLALSDNIEPTGLEHHQSSDNRVPEHTYSDEKTAMLEADLLPHEFTHSWNGKYRRPAGLATPDYATPMRDELLWVYEGMTQYLGDVLAVRSGLVTPQQYREALALSAAELDQKPGRTWRDLQDTAISSPILRGASREWNNWRRGQDYYQEGELVWLDVDTTIRKMTNGQKSLRDFCALFLGKGGNTPAEVVPYTFDDVVNTLNAVVPNNWAAFLNERLNSTAPHAPLGGIERSGYKLVYQQEPTAYESAALGENGVTEAWFSTGITVAKDGTLADVRVGSPAYKAGLGPGMKLIAVNGRGFSGETLKAALQAGKNGGQPLELIVDNTGLFSTVRVDYHDGEKHPALQRVEGTPDMLEEILKPLGPVH